MSAMSDELVKRCPFCGWPASAMMDAGTKVWRVYCNDDGTCGDDAPGCGAEGPEAMTEAKAVSAWNTRAALEAVGSDVERMREALVGLLSFADARNDRDYQKVLNARSAISAVRTARSDEQRMRDALIGCIEHMEWSTPQGRAAYEAARAALEQPK